MSSDAPHPFPRRLAVLGDVHGNWRALAAVLNAIRAAGIHEGVLTGDLTMRGEDPERCIRALRRLEWPGVVGNTDRRVLEPPRPKSHPASQRVGSRSWTHRALSKRSRRYLENLPLTVTLRLGRFRVLVVHGSFDDPAQSLFDPGSSDEHLAALAADCRADVVVTGHTHIAMATRVNDVLFVNPGSVGESSDERDRRPHWAWLEATDDGVVAHLTAVDEPHATVRITRGMAGVSFLPAGDGSALGG